MTELVFEPARKLARLLRTRKVSSAELVTAFIAQIDRVNPAVNAIASAFGCDSLRTCPS